MYSIKPDSSPRGEFVYLFISLVCAFEIIGTSDLLDDFIRRPNQWNPTLPADHLVWHEHTFDDHILNMEEECARLCVEEHGFTCRHFFVDFFRKFCEWIEYGEYYDGHAVIFRHDVYGDAFIRKSTCKQ